MILEVELVGRACDLAAVRKRVLAAQRTAIIGLPGVGKTTLALELASDSLIRAHFLDGILWAGLGQSPNIEALLRAWCKLMLGFSPQKLSRLTREKAIVALQEAIGEQYICLILDDVWASADARTLLQIAGPNCGIVITTRSPVIGTELCNSDSYALSELDGEAGLHLLGLLAPQAVEMEPGKARELVEAVGGLPLALILMGRYLASEAWSGHTRRIVHALERLKDANERLNTGEHSLRSVISLSENVLSEVECAAFHALNVLPPKPGSFSERTALAVAGCTTAVLDTLVDLGLLEPAGEEYRMHQTISDYCQSMFSPTERLLAEERLLASILDEFDARDAEPAWLEREKQTILLAIDAAEHLERHEELIHLTVLFAPFLLYQGWLSQAHTFLQRACERARQQQTAPELPSLLLFLGETLLLLAFVQEGLAAHQEGLSLARRFRDDKCACEILATLAWYAHIYGEYDQADIYIQEGLEIAIPRDYPDQLWVLYRVQGSQAWARGNYGQAEAAYQRGLILVERLSDQSLTDVTMYYCFLAVFAGERGHYTEAEAHFQQGIMAAQAYGFKDFIPFLVARRAMMRLMCDPSDALREELMEAIRAAQAVGSFAYAVYAHKALAQLELIQGNLDRAEEVAHHALALIEPFQTQNRLGEHRTILAQVELARGRYSEAAVYLQQALPLLRIYGAAEDKAISLLTLGELEIGRGDLGAAEAAFRELLAVGPADFLAPLALGHYGLARIAAARRQRSEARRLGEKSLRMLEELKHVRAPEVRIWLNALPTPFLHGLRNKRKPAR